MFVLGLLSLFFVALHAQPCPIWSYDETAPNGPANWGTLCPQYSNCLVGQAQSPINIVHTQQISGRTENLQVSYNTSNNFPFGMIDYAPEGLNFSEHNTISTFGQGPFTLLEFHFHSPSEHFINGIQYPLEVHFVHTDFAGKYVVLGFLYEESALPVKDVFLTSLLPHLPQISVPGVFTTVSALNIRAQVNTNEGFYHYEGSTTIPPCIPGVQFYISATPIAVDAELLAEFEGLNNPRPLQPLNNRTVTFYSPSVPASKASNWAYAVGIGGFGVGLAFVGRYAYTKHKKSRGADESALELPLLKK